MSDFLSRINPFYKFVVVTLFATIFTFVHSQMLSIVVFLGCFVLILVGTRPATWVKAFSLMMPIGILALSVFATGFFWSADVAGDFGSVTLESTRTGVDLVVRLFAFAGLGMLITLTTDPYELVRAMERHVRLPRKFAYGMLCAVHLLPYMREEYGNARLAFLVRGVRVGPISSRVMFSMLANSVRWSESLSVAMHSRGFWDGD